MLSRTLVEKYLPGVDFARISHHLHLQVGLDGKPGETYLLVHDKILYIFHRPQEEEAPSPVRLAPGKIPRLDRRDWSARLFFITSDHTEHTVEINPLDLPEVELLLRSIKRVETAELFPAGPQPAPQPQPQPQPEDETLVEQEDASLTELEEEPTPQPEDFPPDQDEELTVPYDEMPTPATFDGQTAPPSLGPAPAHVVHLPEEHSPAQAAQAPDSRRLMNEVEQQLRRGQYDISSLLDQMAQDGDANSHSLELWTQLSKTMQKGKFIDVFFILDEESDVVDPLLSVFYEALGRELEQQGERELAAIAYEDVPAVEKEAQRLRQELGLEEQQLQEVRRRKAVDHYRKKVQAKYHDAASWERLAMNLFLLEEREAAVHAAKTAIDLDPSRIDALELLTDCLRGTGREGEARELTENILKDRPNDSWLHGKLADILDDYPDDREDALIHCHKAVDLDPENSYARFLRRNILRETRRWSELVRVIEEDLKFELDQEERVALRQEILKAQTELMGHDRHAGRTGCIMLAVSALILVLAVTLIVYLSR